MIDLVNSPDEQVVRISFLFAPALFASALDFVDVRVFVNRSPGNDGSATNEVRFLFFNSNSCILLTGPLMLECQYEPDAYRDALLICRSESRVLCLSLIHI